MVIAIAVLIEIVRTVLVIILVASFFELLLPEGKVKPFVRFAIGLFILISILNPTLNFLYSDRDFQINLWTYQEDMAVSEEILKSGGQIQKQITAQGDEIIKEKFEGQVSAVATLVPGVKQVKTKAQLDQGGAIDNLHILISPEILTGENDDIEVDEELLEIGELGEVEKQLIQEKIQRVISHMYNLENAHIQIEFEGG